MGRGGARTGRVWSGAPASEQGKPRPAAVPGAQPAAPVTDTDTDTDTDTEDIAEDLKERPTARAEKAAPTPPTPPGAAHTRNAERRITALLLTMTALTGLVDSMTFLGLGEVFVANMTGNVAVLGFSLAGATGISGELALNALAFFVLGALLGGRIGARFDHHPRLWLGTVIALQVVLVAGALLLTLLMLLNDLQIAVEEGGRLFKVDSSPADYVLVALLAVAMGLQHATAQRLARPEIPTNVLTTAITMFAIQTRLGGGRGTSPLRQLAGPVVLLASAAAGAFGFLHVAAVFPLVCGLVLVGVSLTLTTANPPLSLSRPKLATDPPPPTDQRR